MSGKDAVNGRFRYSDLKEAAVGSCRLWGLKGPDGGASIGKATVWGYAGQLGGRIPHKRVVLGFSESSREGAHMLETFRGTRTLRYLWYEQRALCTLCHTKITRITGWRLHHCVSRVMGGSAGATNRVLLHPECHDRVHRQRLSVSTPRLL
jgi:hypothetical protein